MFNECTMLMLLHFSKERKSDTSESFKSMNLLLYNFVRVYQIIITNSMEIAHNEF